MDLSNEELVELYKVGFKGALDTLVENNQGIIYKLANSFQVSQNKSIDIEDLIQEGNIGLIDAAERYDPNHENKAKFITYAVHWINMRLHSYFNNNHISPEVETSLNKPVRNSEGDEKELVDYIEGVDYSFENVEEKLFREQLRRELEQVMQENNTLQEREVLGLHYGWYSDRILSLKEVGDILGSTESKAKSIEARALRKIRGSSWGVREMKRKQRMRLKRREVFDSLQPAFQEFLRATEQQKELQ